METGQTAGNLSYPQKSYISTYKKKCRLFY